MDKSVHSELEDNPIDVKIVLAGLWIATLFIFVYVDIISFYKPGIIDDILVGKVWEFEISQAWALIAITLMAVPCFMIFLSFALPANVNRRLNLMVGLIYILVSFGNVIGESWGYLYLGALFEVVFLALIVWNAWRWPSREKS